MALRPPPGVPFLPPATVADRSFAQNVDRIVRRTTIVNDADDIRRNVTLCLVGGRPCTLEMGSNIAVTEGFILPPRMKAFSIDGAQRFKLIPAGDVPFLFYAKGAETNEGFPVEVSNLTVQLKAGAALKTVFVVEQVSAVSAATFSDTLTVTSIYVDATATGASCTNLFAHGDYQHPVGFRVGRFFVEDVSINGVDNVLALGDATMFWTDCSVRNMLVSGSVAATFGQGAASAVFSGIVENLVAPSTVFSVGSRSTVSLQYARLDSFIGTSVSVLGRITLLRVFTATTRTLTAFDVDLDNLNTTSDVTLNSAGPTLTPGAASYVRVTHGAGASGVVTVSGAGAVDGRPVILRFVTVAGTAVYTDGSGNLQLSANFTPTSNDTLTIAYDSTTGLWYECGRSVN